MSVQEYMLGRLNRQSRGYLPIPALIVIIYFVVFYLLHLFCFCNISPFLFEFWSIPHFMGLSLFEVYTGVNILLAAYLLVSVWDLASEKNRRSLRTVTLWAVYAFSFVLLASMQVYIHKSRYNFGLPDEILALRSEYQTLIGQELEDLILPESDMCRGFKKPFEERVIISINRRGEFIRNRRNLGGVDHNLDRIRSLLSSEAESHERDPDGISKLILLLRADTHAEFEHIHKVMQVCKEEGVKIHRIEWHCECDLDRMAPEAVKKIKFAYYRLPPGKLEVHLPESIEKWSDPDRSVKVEIFSKRKDEFGFYIDMDGRTVGGPDMLKNFHAMMEALHDGETEPAVILRVHPGVEYNHVVKVYTECLRAEMKDVLFDSVTGGA